MSGEFLSDGLEATETPEKIKQAEISASKSQASTSHDEVLLDIRDEKLFTKLEQLEVELPATERRRVYSEIMKRNTKLEKYFRPKELKIGPIHWCRFLNHDIKLKLAALFISEIGSSREEIFIDFKSKMYGIRACLDNDIISRFGDEELMRLLFLDGCAILGFIDRYVNRQLKEVGISDAQAGDVEQDLLLLENQIPFQVFEVLLGKFPQKHFLKESFLIFILFICRNTLPKQSPEDLFEYLYNYCFFPEIDMNRKSYHLLDVFREALLFNHPSFDSFGSMLITPIREAFWNLCSLGSVAICYFLVHLKQEPDDTLSRIRRAKQFFQSVQELKAAGIMFKPGHSLKTISFHSRFFVRPHLMLPTLIVDDSTAPKLLNLVAFEMSLSETRPDENHWVSSYVNLLDSLVDNEQDIKDLRAADILRNTLSTDTLAAELINEVGTGCVAPTEDAYIDVREKIGNYYRKACSIWMAQVCNAHFSSPWTIMALFAATAVLILTVVQTWYAVNPTK